LFQGNPHYPAANAPSHPVVREQVIPKRDGNTIEQTNTGYIHGGTAENRVEFGGLRSRVIIFATYCFLRFLEHNDESKPATITTKASYRQG
jgi:hypothetical protein